jgi:hypothetical protein
MRVVDVLGAVLLVMAVLAFVVGEVALARSQDLRALYCLVVGVVALRAAVQVVRPGAKT